MEKRKLRAPFNRDTMVAEFMILDAHSSNNLVYRTVSIEWGLHTKHSGIKQRHGGNCRCFALIGSSRGWRSIFGGIHAGARRVQ